VSQVSRFRDLGFPTWRESLASFAEARAKSRGMARVIRIGDEICATARPRGLKPWESGILRGPEGPLFQAFRTFVTLSCFAAFYFGFSQLNRVIIGLYPPDLR
jgi:hypothetical protein